MADFTYDETPLPLGPRALSMQRRDPYRVRRQRRQSVGPIDDDMELGGPQPGPGNDSGLSELDTPTPGEARDQLRALSGSITQAAGEALAQPQQPTQAPAQAAPQAQPQAQPIAPIQPTPGAPQAPEDDDLDLGAPPTTQLSMPQGPQRPPLGVQPQQLRAPMAQAAGVTGDSWAQLTPPSIIDDEEMDPNEPEPDNDADDEDIGEGLMLKRQAIRDREDAEDRAQSARNSRARTVMAIAGAIGNIFGSPESRAGRQQLINAAMQNTDPNAPGDRRRAQRQEDDLTDWRQAMEERRAAIEDRRIAQAEAATAEHARRTSEEFNADSQSAEGRRATYDAIINGLPEEAAQVLRPWVELDTSGMNAQAMGDTIESLQAVIDDERRSNPNAFRQGQRSGGRRRERGRLAGDLGTGGTGGRDYGYGAYARGGGQVPDTGAAAPPTDQAAPATPPQRPQGVRRAPAAPPVAPSAPQAVQQPGATPQGRPLWDRPPTPEEINADPRRAGFENAVRLYAREQRLDINNQNDRRIAATWVSEATPQQIGELNNRANDRTEQQHAIIMRQVEPRIRASDVVGQLSSAVDSASPAALAAALHGGPGMARVAGAGALRAHILDFVNEYLHEMSGAAVSDGEMERFKTALGTDSVSVDPQVFSAFLRRRAGALDREIDSFTQQYPDGWARYVENHRRQRQ